MRSRPLDRFHTLSVALCLFAGLGAVVPQPAVAQGFAATIAPGRFELKGRPGEKIREVVEIGNAGKAAGRYAIRTADWDLDPQNGVVIHPPALQPDSCRPWTRVERRELKLPPGGKKRYRFEVRIPGDTPSRECRLAILIRPVEGSEAVAQAGNLQFPVAGQIAVIIYVRVGDARPALKFNGLQSQTVGGRRLPAAMFTNLGNAHGRPVGILEGRDAAGQVLDFVVSPLPILPRRDRVIPLAPTSPDDPNRSVQLSFPVSLKGTIEWDGGSARVDTTLR